MRVVKLAREVVGKRTSFRLLDVQPEYEEAVLQLGFKHEDDGFARSFPTDTPQLDLAYANFARYAEQMVRQAAGYEEVPWETALQALLDRLHGREIHWWLTGSAALAVRGLHITPRDLDLVVDDAGAAQLGEILVDRLIDPVTPVTDWICRWWGRAFLHARIEWVGGVDPRADEPFVTDFGPEAARRLEDVTWRGGILRVPPLELQLHSCERRHLYDRARQIRMLIEDGRTEVAGRSPWRRFRAWPP